MSWQLREEEEEEEEEEDAHARELVSAVNLVERRGSCNFDCSFGCMCLYVCVSRVGVSGKASG